MMKRPCRKRFVATLACGVVLACCGNGGVLAQTSAPTLVLPEWQQLTNVQEMLRINQQLQAQVRATELTLDQSLTNARELLRLNQQLQAQLQEARFVFQKNQREARTEAAQNLEAMSALLSQIERNLVACRKRELDQIKSADQSILIAAGGVVGAGLLVIALVAFLHWRVFNSFASSLVTCAQGKSPAVTSANSGETPPAAGGLAGQSAARLPDAIGRLEKRILELEQTAQAKSQPAGNAAAVPAANVPSETIGQPEPGDSESRIAILFGKGLSLLNLDQQEKAIGCFDKILQLDPTHGEALAKKGMALEQLDRLEEAIACYDRAVGVNPLLTVAYLRKGGLCNRLARYDEALKSYEQALQAQGRDSVV